MPAEFERIFHVNICVTDLDRSLKWYQEVLGMKVVEGPFMGEGPAMRGIGIGAESVGVDSKTAVKVRGAFLRWSDNEHEAVIDLLEFINPRPVGAPYETLHNIGIARIALGVKDVDAAYEDLKSKGVKFITPPVSISNMEGAQSLLSEIAYCCFYDPDRTILELYGKIHRK